MSTETASGGAPKPQLKRQLKLWHIVFFGLAYMSPYAVFDTFGLVSGITDGRVPASYIIVTVAMLLTAYSYSRMVRIYPSSGSAYTYTRRTVNDGVGFVVGWVALLDYMFLPLLNALLFSLYLYAQFPTVPPWVWSVSYVVLITLLVVIGVKFSTLVNVVLVLTQIVIVVVFIALIMSETDGSLLSARPFIGGDADFAALAGGASILALAFLGFDAVTTMSEETVDSRKTVSRGVLLVALFGGVFFIVTTYVMQVFMPDAAQPEGDASLASAMAAMVGGPAFQAVFTGGVFASFIAGGVAAQTSGSRLMYAMGRDGVLPRRVFGRIQPRLGTPVLNILIVGAFALLSASLSLIDAISFVNFGALIAFAFVNLSLIFWFFRSKTPRTVMRWIMMAVIPGLGFLYNLYLFVNLDSVALTVGAAWSAVGILMLVVVTRGFKRKPPQVEAPAESAA